MKRVECLMNTFDITLLTAGENGLVVEFGSVISQEINVFIKQFTRLLASTPVQGIIETVPTYRSVTIYFNPLTISRNKLSKVIRDIINTIQPKELNGIPSKIVHIPVCYGGVLGPDLEYVARYTGLSANKVIKLHTAKPYLVYMLGFIPGFPYLGGLPEQLIVPRLETPRTKVPAGSVGIGGSQTGFYPIESQGEWWLIGRTPVKAFNPKNLNPFLVAAGDYIQFVNIGMDDYFKIRKEIALGTYEPQISFI